ncbi:hypothetical protein P8452_73798 [Trifolium repens]|nr:hypothetical protein P8452_73798 [Trifolium repens]
MDYAAIPDYIKMSLPLSASRTMLLCFDKGKDLPDHCLRQFGMHQTISNDVEWWERKSLEGGNILDEDEYMQWYQQITRKHIGRVTSSVESENSYCYEGNCEFC